MKRKSRKVSSVVMCGYNSAGGTYCHFESLHHGRHSWDEERCKFALTGSGHTHECGLGTHLGLHECVHCGKLFSFSPRTWEELDKMRDVTSKVHL